jgi:hypothetical protein
MTKLGPSPDVYSLTSRVAGSLPYTKSWDNEILVLLANILGATVSGINSYIMDPGTLARLPFVTRGDGIRALPVDTELVIDNATVKIENLFVASNDGALTGAGFMYMTAAAIGDNYTPPATNVFKRYFLL